MQAPASSPFGSNFMAQARGARQRLSAALSALRTATRVSERMRSDWTKFESQLLHQLCAEEELLLPAFDLAHYADATRVRHEHNELRALLVAIDASLAEQRLDGQALAALQRLLERNGSFQERSLFAWSQRCLTPSKLGEFQTRTQPERASRRPPAKRVSRTLPQRAG